MINALANGPERAWSLRVRDDEVTLGLVYFLGDTRSGSIGLGYILHPDHWRCGLMTEAVRAVLDYGFDALGLDRVELWIDAENFASLALATRLGFNRRSSFVQRFPHAADARENLVLGLSIDQWRPGSPRRRRPLIAAHSLVPVLPVTDVRGSAEFYRDMFGFGIAFLYGDPPTYGGVWLGEWAFTGFHIHLSQRAVIPSPPPGFALYLSVGPGLDDLCELFRSRGVAIVEEPETRPWGQREFVAADCNGYLLRFGTAA
jgi:catechol 2,3-dioxygenase-like lactoylglutathione lyase family enzyme